MSGWIGMDLDGTLAEYGGWQGPLHIGRPVPAMLARVKAWLAEGQEVRIFTARIAHDDSGDCQHEIELWCQEHIGQKLPVTCRKDYGMVELWDDRCVQVIPNTGRRAAMKVIVVVGDRWLTGFLQACDVIEPFKALAVPVGLNVKMKDGYPAAPALDALRRGLEQAGHRIVAIFCPGTAEGAWRDELVQVISDGRKFEVLDDVLARLGWVDGQDAAPRLVLPEDQGGREEQTH